MKTPKSLLEAMRLFSDADQAHEYLRDLRWPDGAIPCPKCGKTEHYFLANQKRWKCKACKKQFSVKVGTIFEDSPLPLDKWLVAVWIITNAKNGVSSCELARSLEVTQKTAWFMLHRIRAAMSEGTLEKLNGQVEADETYIGGKARNMHKEARKKRITGTGGKDKTIVLGVLGRDGTVRTKVAETSKRRDLHSFVQANVAKGSDLFTDALRSYRGLEREYKHAIVDHATCYAVGHVHTNGLENYWSLLKRTLSGTYVSVEPFHLFRYLDEQAFRFNERAGTDADRFVKATVRTAGRRLTYARLTGKELAAGA